MFGRADAQEQQRLRHSVENDQENGRPHRFRRADASTGDDQAQVGDGRVREHALSVALRDGHEGSQAERETANEHDHGRRHGENQEQRRELDKQEAASFHHGGRMQKCAGGCRRDHSAQKPRVERHLRRLRHAGEREQGHGQNEHAGRDGVGDGRVRSSFQKHAEQARLALKTKPENCRLEREAAQHVHDDLAECIVDGFFGLREADEQERAQRSDFPGCVNPTQVVGKHNVVHGGKEREHEREEPRTAVFLLGVMRLEIFHVAKRVHANARADDTQDEHHDDAERIDMHLAFELHLALNIVFKPQRGKNLANCQHERQHAAILHRVAHDVQANRDIDDDIDYGKEVAVLHGEVEIQRTRAQILDGERDGEQRDNGSGRHAQHIASFIGTHDEHEQRCHARHHDQRDYQFHKHSCQAIKQAGIATRRISL